MLSSCYWQFPEPPFIGLVSPFNCLITLLFSVSINFLRAIIVDSYPPLTAALAGSSPLGRFTEPQLSIEVGPVSQEANLAENKFGEIGIIIIVN